MTESNTPNDDEGADYSTMEVARMLGLAVRSIQLMVDRGELTAWKTPGGHRRISSASVRAWQLQRQGPAALARSAGRLAGSPAEGAAASKSGPTARRILVIEDSVHYQTLIGMLLKQQFPELELHSAHDGIVGLAMVGQLQPEVLIVDILLPGIDGATLITSLRSHAQFAHSRLIVCTSLDEDQRQPFAFALSGVPVVHKPRLVLDLPGALRAALNPGTAA